MPIKLRRLIPPSAIEYARVLIANIIRKNVSIASSMVSRKAQLAENVLINRGTVVRDLVTIGDYTYIHRYSVISNAVIGKYCSISDHVNIGPFEHPYKYLSLSPRVYTDILKKPNQYNDIPKPAIVGNDVWIGSGATILGGG
jgi:UDP-3-O-[3-hydroxymyristoyl] glucosamine N-acyltransferase